MLSNEDDEATERYSKQWVEMPAVLADLQSKLTEYQQSILQKKAMNLAYLPFQAQETLINYAEELVETNEQEPVENSCVVEPSEELLQEKDKQIERYEKQRVILQDENESLRIECKKATQQLQSTTLERDEAQATLQSMKNQNRDLERKVQDLEIQVDHLGGKLEDQELENRMNKRLHTQTEMELKAVIEETGEELADKEILNLDLQETEQSMEEMLAELQEIQRERNLLQRDLAVMATELKDTHEKLNMSEQSWKKTSELTTNEVRDLKDQLQLKTQEIGQLRSDLASINDSQSQSTDLQCELQKWKQEALQSKSDLTITRQLKSDAESALNKTVGDLQAEQARTNAALLQVRQMELKLESLKEIQSIQQHRLSQHMDTSTLLSTSIIADTHNSSAEDVTGFFDFEAKEAAQASRYAEAERGLDALQLKISEAQAKIVTLEGTVKRYENDLQSKSAQLKQLQDELDKEKQNNLNQESKESDLMQKFHAPPKKLCRSLKETMDLVRLQRMELKNLMTRHTGVQPVTKAGKISGSAGTMKTSETVHFQGSVMIAESRASKYLKISGTICVLIITSDLVRIEQLGSKKGVITIFFDDLKRFGEIQGMVSLEFTNSDIGIPGLLHVVCDASSDIYSTLADVDVGRKKERGLI
eukprot:m.98414 g.98414  ORF g.98414 m.98414 type:complete len:649 (+) comp13636_c0_seq1:319-2265(+)